MSQEMTVVGARVATINTIVSKINHLQQQIGSLTSSDTTNGMLLVLGALKKNLQDVMETYVAVMSNKPIAYHRKYAGTGTGADKGKAESELSDVQQALALAEICNKNKTNHENDEYAVVYKIQPGDTLSELAKKYHVSVDDICRLNNIKNRNLIRSGADLLIPISLPIGMALPMMISGIPLKHIGNTSGNNSSASNASSASNSNAVKNGATSATDTGKANSQANTTPSAPTQSTTTSGNGNFTVTKTGDKKVSQYDVKTQSQNGSYSGTQFNKIDNNGNQIPDSGTIGSSGCGPSSFATCINALNGSEIENPVSMCKYAQDCRSRGPSGTAMETLFSEWCKDHPEYNYKTLFSSVAAKRTQPNNSEINALVEALKQGKVGTLGTDHIRSQNGNVVDKNIFAGAQHIVAVTGIEESENGIRLVISDPNVFDGDKLNPTYNGRCVKTGRVEMIGDKTYVDLDDAAKYIRSIRIISK